MGLGASKSYIPRSNAAPSAPKRSPARAPEAWESQVPVHTIGGKWDQKGETAEEYLEFMREWQRKHGGASPGRGPSDPGPDPGDVKKPGGKGGRAGLTLGWPPSRPDPLSPTVPEEVADVPSGAEAGAPAEAEEAPGASTISWTSADTPVDASDTERKSNRQRAPVDWEAGAGQERTAVMGILGGRKR